MAGPSPDTLAPAPSGSMPKVGRSFFIASPRDEYKVTTDAKSNYNDYPETAQHNHNAPDSLELQLFFDRMSRHNRAMDAPFLCCAMSIDDRKLTLGKLRPIMLENIGSGTLEVSSVGWCFSLPNDQRSEETLKDFYQSDCLRLFPETYEKLYCYPTGRAGSCFHNCECETSEHDAFRKPETTNGEPTANAVSRGNDNVPQSRGKVHPIVLPDPGLSNGLAIEDAPSSPLDSSLIMHIRNQKKHLREDSASLKSVRTGSEMSFSTSTSKKRRNCYICKIPSPFDAALVACSQCRRSFHRGCHTTPAIPSGSPSDWQCYKCIKEQHARRDAPADSRTSLDPASEVQVRAGTDLDRPAKRAKVRSPPNETSSHVAESVPGMVGATTGIGNPTLSTNLANDESHMSLEIPETPREKDVLAALHGPDSQKESQGQASPQPSPAKSSATGSPYGRSLVKLRPAYSYIQLIGMALLQAPDHRLQRSAIHEWIARNIPGYKLKDGVWERGISTTLTQKSNGPIEKQEKSCTDAGKGSWWAIRKGQEYHFITLEASGISAVNNPTTGHGLDATGLDRAALPTVAQGQSQTVLNSADTKLKRTTSGSVPSKNATSKRPTPPKPRPIQSEVNSHSKTFDWYALGESPDGGLHRISNISAADHKRAGLITDAPTQSVASSATIFARKSSKSAQSKNMPFEPERNLIVSAPLKSKEVPDGLEDINSSRNVESKEDGGQSQKEDVKFATISEDATARNTFPDRMQDTQIDTEPGLSRSDGPPQQDESDSKVLTKFDVTIKSTNNVTPHMDTPPERTQSTAGPTHLEKETQATVTNARPRGDLEAEILDRIKERMEPRYTCSSLFAAYPEYSPEKSSLSSGASQAEINARPSRKQLFGKSASISRLGPRVFRERMDAINRALSREPSAGLVSGGEGNDHSSLPGASAWNADELGEPEEFESIEDLLGIPQVVVPIIYENQLVFRDTSRSATGRSTRAKNYYRVGYHAKGQ